MKNIILLTFLSINSIVLLAQDNSNSSEELHKKLQEIYDRGYITGFSIAIVNENDILFEQGYGQSDIKNNQPYTENTIQNIASISKTFIGIALLKAQELGKLQLDDPINKYLPFEVNNPYYPETPITIRQLTTHTSGITDPKAYEKSGYVLKNTLNEDMKVNSNFIAPDNLMTYNQFLRNILSKKGKWYKKKNFNKTEPGASFDYSNIGAGLAAYVLEQATGTPFNEFTKQYILAPLKMDDSGWFYTNIDSSLHSKLYTTEGTEVAPYTLINYPDGGMITSANNLGKYLQELIAGYNGNGHILTKESFKELYTTQLSDTHYSNRDDGPYDDEYNMSVFMGFSAENHIGHTGGDPGVATILFFNKHTNIGKLLIINSDLNNEGVQAFIDIWMTLEAYENKL
ncbi:MAG: hypothetical protein BM563_08940 [Bacteroidetes bacterium MedPE-SWsnd-G1]|nr:MAG: hypothetical protein BM563_08940 [Bacteroidetes bacterium MedPE-SWsnd-G1]